RRAVRLVMRIEATRDVAGELEGVLSDLTGSGLAAVRVFAPFIECLVEPLRPAAMLLDAIHFPSVRIPSCPAVILAIIARVMAFYVLPVRDPEPTILSVILGHPARFVFCAVE